MRLRKKVCAIIGFLLAAMMLCGVFAACGETESGPGEDVTPTVVGIEIARAPKKTEYEEFQKFIATGTIINAKMSDGTSKRLNAKQFTYTPSRNTLLIEDVTKVVFSYGEFTAEQPIKVNPLVIESIAVSQLPYTTMYMMQQSSVADFSGLSVEATLEGGAKRTFTARELSLTLDGNPIANGDTLEVGGHTVTATLKGHSATFDIDVINGYVVEAENIIKTAEIKETDQWYVEQLNGSTNNYHSVSNPGEPASGGAYMGEVNAGAKMVFHIHSEEARKADIILRAASGIRGKTQKSENPGMKDADEWTPVTMEPIVFNKGFKVTLGSSKTPITIADEVVLPGSQALNPDGTLNTMGDMLLWVKWADVSFGEIELAKGDNTITVEVSAKVNIDRLEVRFHEDHEHNASTLRHFDAEKSTCTVNGVAEYWKCRICGGVYSDAAGKERLFNIATMPHSSTLEPVPGTPATCDATGIADHWKCTVDGAEFIDSRAQTKLTSPDMLVTAKHSATLVHHAAVAPVPCASGKKGTDGTAEYWQCSECGKYFADAKAAREIDAPVPVLRSHFPASIAITTPPAIVTYVTGQAFNPNGMIVTAACASCGETYAAADYEVTPRVMSADTRKVVVSYTENGATVTADVAVTVFDGVIAEAENFKKAADIKEGDKNFWEYSKGGASKDCDKRDDGGSDTSGGLYLGELADGQTFKIHVWSDTARKADIILRAASGSVNKWSGAAWTPPLSMNAIKFNDAFDVKLGTATESLKIADSVELPASSTDDPNGDMGLWTKWADVSFGQIDLEPGDNTITLTIKSKPVNIDCLKVRFADKGGIK